MDISQLPPVVVLPVLLAILFAPQAYAAVRQWKLPQWKTDKGQGETPTVGQKHSALLVLESAKGELPGYYKGLAQVRRNFLPPITPASTQEPA